MVLSVAALLKKYRLAARGVIHIGAHHGQEFQEYVGCGISNMMFFEPLPAAFEILKSNVEPGCVLVNKALGNENRKATMFVETANQGMSSSMLKPSLHLKQYPQIAFDGTAEVDMVRLDDYLKDPSPYNLIAIDVQGYELEVFKGARATLSSIDAIISEVSLEPLYEGSALVGDVDRYLGGLGFVRRETLWSGKTWGDAFFLKRSANMS